MRLLFLLYFFLAVNILFAQSFKITDVKGNAISYVAIGVLNTEKGTVADENGFVKFSELKSTDTLIFSHLNYERKKLAITSDMLKNKNIINIKLVEKTIEIKEVTVNSKALKMRYIKRGGVLIPGSEIVYDNTTGKDNDLGTEYGEIIETKKDFIIRELNITCFHNSIDTCIFRFNLYSIDQDSTFKALLPKPVYITFLKSDKKVKRKISLNHYIPKGIIWVGLEVVKFGSKGSCAFPLAVSNGYMRDSNSNELEKLPMGLGHFFSLKGYYIKNK